MIRSLLDAGFRVGASRALQGRARAMTASSESNSSSTTSAAAEATAQLTLWGRICRWATWGTFGTIVLFAISQPFLRMWDSPFGPSIPTMISESMLIVGILLLLVWVGLFSRWRWFNKAAVLIPALGLIGGFIASVRSIDLSGDIGITFEYKWQDTQAERIAAHKAKLDAASPVAGSLVPSDKTPRPAQSTPDSTFVAATHSALTLSPVTPEDSPAYRGANRDGIVTGPQICTSWPSAPKPLWTQPVGGGYASMAVVGDLLVTIEQRDDNEAIFCYQASTGRELWIYQYPAKFWEAMGGPGPRSTPTIDGDLVFAQGAEGELVCLELATGQKKWSKNLLTEFKLSNTAWGITPSPLVIEQRVIANAGGRRGNGLAAFDRLTGELLWSGEGLKPSSAPVVEVSSTNDTPVVDEVGHQVVEEAKRNRPGYSSSTLVTIQGVPQILSFDGTGLRGSVPETGQVLWFHPHENTAAVNAAQPILFDDGRIFITCSYGIGSAMVQVSKSGDAWSVNKLWENFNMRSKFASPVLFEGYLYGLDEGILVCLDSQTGDRKWKKGRYNHGQLMLTNGVLVVLTEDGRCVFVKPSPERLEELGEFPALSDDYKTWNPPALVRGKLFVRNHHDMACYDLVK